jgi:putative transposase
MENMVNRICPKCKSKEIIRWGKRVTENRGKIQRWKCKSCSETFINDSFARMRNSHQKVTCALDLFYRGVSTRKVQEHFKAFYPHNSSHKSIYTWVIKYAKMISKFTNQLKLSVGEEAQQQS